MGLDSSDRPAWFHNGPIPIHIVVIILEHTQDLLVRDTRDEYSSELIAYYSAWNIRQPPGAARCKKNLTTPEPTCPIPVFIGFQNEFPGCNRCCILARAADTYSSHARTVAGFRSAAEALNASAIRASPILVFTSIYRATLAGPLLVVLLAGIVVRIDLNG